jgi:hypothetical protein
MIRFEEGKFFSYRDKKNSVRQFYLYVKLVKSIIQLLLISYLSIILSLRWTTLNINLNSEKGLNFSNP